LRMRVREGACNHDRDERPHNGQSYSKDRSTSSRGGFFLIRIDSANIGDQFTTAYYTEGGEILNCHLESAVIQTTASQETEQAVARPGRTPRTQMLHLEKKVPQNIASDRAHSSCLDSSSCGF